MEPLVAASGVLVAFLLLYLGVRWLLMVRNDMFVVAGKHCVVTGGSSGIGEQVAHILVKQGCSVTIMARGKEKLNEVLAAMELRKTAPGQLCHAVAMDASANYEVVEAAMKDATAHCGDIDALIHCVGTSWPLEFDVMEVGQYERMLRVNTLSAMFAARAVLPGMKRRRAGRIVFVSSAAGQVGIYGFTAYGAAKFALRGLAEALLMEVRHLGIGVSVAYPPDTLTPGFKEENRIKPRAVHVISASGGIFPAERVAADIVRGMVTGRFAITTGMDGWFLALGTQGMAPCFSVVEAAAQILLASLLRFIFLFYTRSFYKVAAAESTAAATAEESLAAHAAAVHVVAPAPVPLSSDKGNGRVGSKVD